MQYLYNFYELFLPLKLIKLRNFIFGSHLVLNVTFCFFQENHNNILLFDNIFLLLFDNIF